MYAGQVSCPGPIEIIEYRCPRCGIYWKECGKVPDYDALRRPPPCICATCGEMVFGWVK